MKIILSLIGISFFATLANAQISNGTAEEMRSLGKQISALTDAFAKGDAALVTKLHHPNIVKYFGKDNVVTGRAQLQKGLTEWFNGSTVEFIENKVESTVFTGETAIQTCIFSIKSTPKNGGAPVISRGRSMVVYVRDKTSPTGWLSLREMAQEAPAQK